MTIIPLMNLKRMNGQILPEIQDAIQSVIKSNQFINGPDVVKFEEAFSNYSKIKNVVGVSNGTDAIMAVLKALDIGSGDEVIVPTMTFISSAEAVTMVGAKIVFVDVREDNYCIDYLKVKDAISKNTKAIIAVHLHGNVAELDELVKISNEYKLYLIEDSAQAHGAVYKGISIGNFGIAATFSFFPGKNLGAFGDAGAIGTRDNELAKKIRKMINHGREDKYHHDIEGYNMRLDTIQAAILNVKLKYLDKWNSDRVKKAEYYRTQLDAIGVPYTSPKSNIDYVYHLFAIRVKNRNKVLEYMKKEGIDTGIHYPVPLHLQGAYKYLGHSKGDFPVSEKIAEDLLSLPLDPFITTEEQDLVIKALISALV